MIVYVSPAASSMLPLVPGWFVLLNAILFIATTQGIATSPRSLEWDYAAITSTAATKSTDQPM